MAFFAFLSKNRPHVPKMIILEKMFTARSTIRPLVSASQTAKEMERLVRTYSKDLGPKIKWSLPRIYDHVRALEFRPDPLGVETLSRPALTLQKDYPWRDCDDRAIILGSWCYENGIPFFFRASSKHPSKKLHHVYAVCKIKGKEIPLDATYPRNKLGKEEPYTAISNLSGEIRMNSLNTLEGDYTDGELLGFNPMKKLKRGISRTFTPKELVPSFTPKGLAKAALMPAFSPQRLLYNTVKGPSKNKSFMRKIMAKKMEAQAGPTALNNEEAKKYAALQDAIKKAGKIQGKITLSLPGTLSGDEMGSWWSSLKRKTKNVGKKGFKLGKKVAGSSAVQAGLNAYMPGAGTALASVVGKGKKGITDMGTALDDKNAFIKYATMGGIGLAAAAVLYLIFRRK